MDYIDFKNFRAESELCHHGILGQKWGVRRYQNEDGSLTDAGKRRYGELENFRASNGMKVAPAKNGYVRVMRKIASGRGMERMSTKTYKSAMKQGFRKQTAAEKASTQKGIDRIRKESQALREYNAAVKDARKGTGTKYLDKAKRMNEIDKARNYFDDNERTIDKLVFDDSVKEYAARLVVDKNLSYQDALKKSKAREVISTGAAFAIAMGIAAYTVKKG